MKLLPQLVLTIGVVLGGECKGHGRWSCYFPSRMWAADFERPGGRAGIPRRFVDTLCAAEVW